MCLSRVVAATVALFVFPALSDVRQGGTIFHELRSALSSRKLAVGVNLKTGDVVGTGVCEGGARSYERARLAALADIVSQLNDSSFSSSRMSEYSDETSRSKEVVDIACSGYLIGAEEVARIVRQKSDGESVAVAFRWSVAMQEQAMSGLASKEGRIEELEAELQKCNDLVKRTGPVLWTGSSGQKRFLGIAASKVDEMTSKGIRTAMRLAKVKAQRYLGEHFRRVLTEGRHLSEDIVTKPSLSAPMALDSFMQEIKSRTRGALGNGLNAIVATDYGISEIFSEIKTVGNVRYAVSVCCLTTKDMLTAR